MVTGNAELVDLKKRPWSIQTWVFNRDVKRHLRIKYPTKILKRHPLRWMMKAILLCSNRLSKTVWSRSSSSFICYYLRCYQWRNQEYSLDEVPEWVDRVYPAEETIEQINYNGKYKDGFWMPWFLRKMLPKRQRAITIFLSEMTFISTWEWLQQMLTKVI